MKFAMASYGTRGDIEPSVAVARELQRRGHEVRMAVPPDLIGFARGVGLDAIGYGCDMHPQLDEFRDRWTSWTRHFWKVKDLVAVARLGLDSCTRQWEEVGKSLLTLADGVDLLSTGVGFEQTAANVAEHYGIPLVALHTMPWRPNGRLFPPLPAPVARLAMTTYDWLGWRLTRRAEDAQRRELGLPQATSPAPRRMAELGCLEIQAYDEASVPGLADEWAEQAHRRPFVGALTMGLSTDADADVEAWLAAGRPPICFAFGSIPVENPDATVEMIGAACAELGERALVCAGGTDISALPRFDHVKVVGVLNYASIFSSCRAVVHHGGSGTTAASLRGGVPTVVLWSVGDQPLWGSQIKRLRIGTARRFSSTTCESLIADLGPVLTAECADRARAVAERMTAPGESVCRTADLMERAARR